jgi:uncharacterized protein YxeA
MSMPRIRGPLPAFILMLILLMIVVAMIILADLVLNNLDQAKSYVASALNVTRVDYYSQQAESAVSSVSWTLTAVAIAVLVVLIIWLEKR